MFGINNPQWRQLRHFPVCCQEQELSAILFPKRIGLVSNFDVPVLFRSNSFRKRCTFGSNPNWPSQYRKTDYFLDLVGQRACGKGFVLQSFQDPVYLQGRDTSSKVSYNDTQTSECREITYRAGQKFKFQGTTSQIFWFWKFKVVAENL